MKHHKKSARIKLRVEFNRTSRRYRVAVYLDGNLQDDPSVTAFVDDSIEAANLQLVLQRYFETQGTKAALIANLNCTEWPTTLETA